MTPVASDPAEPASEWFVLQERRPGAEWEDCMSLAAWHDPAVRSEALAGFREADDVPPGTEYRMARRTESILSPGARKAPELELLEEALFLRMNGERAPGGNETWRDWDGRAESFLRSLLPPEAEGGAS
jgi:hypothetical protein